MIGELLIEHVKGWLYSRQDELSENELERLVGKFRSELWPDGIDQENYDRCMIGNITLGKVSTMKRFEVCFRGKVIFHSGIGDADAVHQYLLHHLRVGLTSVEMEQLVAWLITGTTYPDAAAKQYLANDDLREQLLSEMGYGNIGTKVDFLPEGFGRFGLDLTNPVPVRGIREAELYMARLRSRRYGKVTFVRDVSCDAENIDFPVDCYLIYREPDKSIVGRVYISPYQRHTSAKAPEGFYLLPNHEDL